MIGTVEDISHMAEVFSVIYMHEPRALSDRQYCIC
jgi:hypothetical protein